MRTVGLLLIICLFVVTTTPLGAAAKVSDDKIYDEVKLKLASDAQVKGGAFAVDVKEGVVTLQGKVRTAKVKDRAERLAKKIKGVTKVVNKLTIEP